MSRVDAAPRRAALAVGGARRSPRCSSGRSSRPIRTTTPTTTWSGAASSLRRDKPTFEAYRRRPSTRCTWRSARCSALVGDRRAIALLVLVCVLSLVALVWAVYRARRARASGRGRALLGARCSWPRASPSCSTRRAPTSTCPFLALVLWAAALEAERRGAAPRVMALLARRRACCARRRGCSPARTGCGAAGGAAPAAAPARRCAARRAGAVVRCVDLLGHRRPAATRCTRPASSPTSCDRSRGLAHGARARSCRSSPTRRARRSRSPALAGRRARRGACATGARCTCRSRCSAPASVTFVAHRRRRPVDAAALPDRPGVALCLFAGYALLGLHDAAAGPPARRCGRAAAIGAAVVGVGLRRRQGAGRRQAARRAALHPRHARRPRGDPRRARGARATALRPDDAARTTGSCPTRAGCSTLPRGEVGARSDQRRDARRGDVRRSGRRSCSATASPPARARRPTRPTRASSPIAHNAALRRLRRCG